MPPRALWTGAISFGLVTIPVALHRAVRDARPRFRMLHAKDKSPVRFERVCERDGRPVPWADVVKGYEYEKGRFVVLTPEDLKKAALEKSNAFEILDFVAADDIDDRFFETPYYVAPGKGGDRAYAVLREALRETGKTGVGKIMLRQTQHLAALEAIDQALVLTIMRFPHELADLSDFRFPAERAGGGKDVAMAKRLIEELSDEWKPEKYKDEYEANLERLIRAKLKGREARLKDEGAPEPPANVVDLMERLKQSLGGGASARAKTTETRASKGARKARQRRRVA